MIDEDPLKHRSSPRFPTTHWSMLEAVRGSMTAQQRETLNFLILRYWKPVYVYIRQRGYESEAEDLTQDFFLHSLARELFGRADRARGRFRTFLLACLNNFLSDIEDYRRRRRPAEGIVSIHELALKDKLTFELSDDETPETLFCRSWVYELLIRVFRVLEQEFKASGKEIHCELFRRRVFEPALWGSPPPLDALAAEAGLTTRQASNRMVTALRAFQRLLREEIRIYAVSEDEVTSEIHDLFRGVARR